jgi:hypothetical protein
MLLCSSAPYFTLSASMWTNCKDWRSASKFRKIANSQICGLKFSKDLRTFSKRGNRADLRFANHIILCFADPVIFRWLTITILRICDLRTGTPQKFADLRLQNEPKHLQIYDLRTNKKNFLTNWQDLSYSMLHTFFMWKYEMCSCRAFKDYK